MGVPGGLPALLYDSGAALVLLLLLLLLLQLLLPFELADSEYSSSESE